MRRTSQGLHGLGVGRRLRHIGAGIRLDAPFADGTGFFRAGPLQGGRFEFLGLFLGLRPLPRLDWLGRFHRIRLDLRHGLRLWRWLLLRRQLLLGQRVLVHRLRVALHRVRIWLLNGWYWIADRVVLRDHGVRS